MSEVRGLTLIDEYRDEIHALKAQLASLRERIRARRWPEEKPEKWRESMSDIRRELFSLWQTADRDGTHNELLEKLFTYTERLESELASLRERCEILTASNTRLDELLAWARECYQHISLDSSGWAHTMDDTAPAIVKEKNDGEKRKTVGV